jgi:hypothetical protein
MRYFLLFIFLLIATKAIAPDLKELAIIKAYPVDLYERLIKAVIEVESNGDTLAFNPVEQAYGIMQIRPIRLLDYNQRTGKKYKMKDCFRPEISREIFLYYARGIGYPDYERISRSWNGSGAKTLEYWDKVKASLEGKFRNKAVKARP